MYSFSRGDNLCLTVLFCLDVSLGIWWGSSHESEAAAEDVPAVEVVTETVTPASSTPIATAASTPATTNAPAAADDLLAPHGTLWEHDYSDYTVRTVRGPDYESDSILQIFKSGRLIYSNSSHTFFDPVTDAPAPYVNITGNGIPNLVVTAYSGGAHCCSIYHIFELGDEFREVATIDAADGGAVFTNLTANGTPAIQMSDWSYAYEFTSFAGSFAPDIILRWIAVGGENSETGADCVATLARVPVGVVSGAGLSGAIPGGMHGRRCISERRALEQYGPV